MRHDGIYVAILVFLLPLFLEAAAKPCVDGKSAKVYECKGVTLQSRVALKKFAGKPGVASSIWGYVDADDNREYAILGLENGTGFVDVTNPTRPTIVGHIPGVKSRWREIKVYSVKNKQTKKWDAYAYISTEGFDGGIQIVDLSELPNRVSLSATVSDVYLSHTLFISDIDYATGIKSGRRRPRLFIHGGFLEDPDDPSLRPAYLLIYSLKNPKDPKLIGEWDDSYVHDSYVETFTNDARCGGRSSCQILFAFTGEDFRILDVTKPSSIQLLSTLLYPQVGYSHSGWISQDKQYLFHFDEGDEFVFGINTRILTFDISNFANTSVVATYNGKSKEVEHNGIVIGNTLYLSHYTRGFVVMDVTDPLKIRERAFFDTHPKDNGLGAWGIYPFLPSGNILISDVERGLFVLKEE